MHSQRNGSGTIRCDMADLATFLGATIGALIIFPLVAKLLLWPLKGWHSEVLKYLVALGICYVLATMLYAYGEADELRAQMSFWEIVSTRSNWLLYLPGSVLAAAFLIFRERGRKAVS